MHLEQLSNAFGVSSVEGDVRKIILEAAKTYADEWRVDTMGNLFVTRNHRGNGSSSPRRVMVTAHMDEVGFMISEIKSNGRLKFKAIGGFDRRVLLGKAVVVGQERVPGVIGLKPVHLLKRGEYDNVDDIDSMYIDIGASGDNGGGKVSVGDFATFATQFGYLGGQPRRRTEQGLVKGKAFDNRAGCAVLLELLKGDYPVDLVAVFTVQEEIGLRGARVAAYATQPDQAFILECTAADDLPSLDEDVPEGFPRLGDGPAITVMDRSFIADRRLVDLLVATAEAEGIPHQFKRPGIGGTDAGAVHLAREGVPAVVVSVPARYIHSPAAVLDLADFWNTVKLMQATLRRLPEQER
ncbi:MAG: M20/M25/M40 family metallo-hydrolase [Anaerolineae bacterium]|nr:M20/M25/M40 family metallo-hydrolase [Anaerolineae bacterium]